MPYFGEHCVNSFSPLDRLAGAFLAHNNSQSPTQHLPASATVYLQGNAVSPSYIRPPVPQPTPDDDIMRHMHARADVLRSFGIHSPCAGWGLFPTHLPQHAAADGFADAVAAVTLGLCVRLYPAFMADIRGEFVVSSVVAEDTMAKRCAVVALGIGTKFLHTQVAQAQGVGTLLVKDSHAEVCVYVYVCAFVRPLPGRCVHACRGDMLQLNTKSTHLHSRFWHVGR